MAIDPRQVAQRVFRDRMAPLLALADLEPDASEVFVDGDEVRLSWGDRDELIPWSDSRLRGMTQADVRAAGSNAAVFAGVEFGPTPPAFPRISVKIPPNLRVTYACPPIADTWHTAVRFLRSRKLRLADYVEQGAMTAAQAEELRELLLPSDGTSPLNVLVSGGTGTGKTTLLRAMISELLEMLEARGHRERILVLEDTPELVVPEAKHLHTALNVDMAELVRTTLRMTPDRIIVGEVRGPEADELVTAMNTGHDGTLATIHSNGTKEALGRILRQCRKVQPHTSLDEITAAVGAVVQITGKGRNRRVTDIWRVPR